MCRRKRLRFPFGIPRVMDPHTDPAAVACRLGCWRDCPKTCPCECHR